MQSYFSFHHRHTNANTYSHDYPASLCQVTHKRTYIHTYTHTHIHAHQNRHDSPILLRHVRGPARRAAAFALRARTITTCCRQPGRHNTLRSCPVMSLPSHELSAVTVRAISFVVTAAIACLACLRCVARDSHIVTYIHSSDGKRLQQALDPRCDTLDISDNTDRIWVLKSHLEAALNLSLDVKAMLCFAQCVSFGSKR